MTSEINRISRVEALGLIFPGGEIKLSKIAEQGWRKCLRNSTAMWAGYIKGNFVCMFGLITPTFADNRVYLWLHVTEEINGREFIFVRRSQIAVKEMLKTWPVIYGHCEVSAYRSRRWVKWLGARFGEPEGQLVPFQIVRADG